MSESTNIKLTVRGLKKTFDGKETLHGLDFDVYDGEFLSILGPSGCGKTTTLRILMGLTPQDAGTLLLDGRDISSVSPSERNMGFVFQNYALFENMSVSGNVEYALKFKPDLKDKRHQIAKDLLEKVGLSDYSNKSVRDLSGGQQQRVSIARTLALKPEIILFDEPMSALDVETRLSLRAMLKQIQKDYGTTMIYVTHDQEEAFALSDRIMVMNEGDIRQLATPDEILTNPADDYIESFVVRNLRLKMNSLVRFIDR